VLPYFLERSDEDWRRPGPRPSERPYFLFVGRLETYKGLDTLIDAWRGIREWDLLVAGTGGAEPQLRARAASNPAIRFLGPQSQRQLGALYAHALASIVPSTTYETFGIVLIESLARKTPVIARDLGALPEVVDDSGGGFHYRTGEELLHQVRRLGSEPRLREEMGELGYRAFLRYWTREAHLECYERHINEAGRLKQGLTQECQLT
jgi:glycosyltransferase involved in cell wall biosynthesis